MRDIFSLDKNLEKLYFPDLSTPNPVLSTVEVKYSLPDYVIITEEDDIRVGIWDEETQ